MNMMLRWSDFETIEIRSCGECSACCTALNIWELDKQAHRQCPHCTTGTSCDIYPDRPGSCQEFFCLWRYGHGTQGDRPNITGLVQSFKLTHNGLSMTMSEYRIGALDTDAVRAETRELLGEGVVVTHMPIGRRWRTYMPASRVEYNWIFYSDRLNNVTEHVPASEYFR